MANPTENLLIILSYLFNNTDDKHKTSEKEIVKYAKDNFKIDIDPRSICTNFLKIKDFYDAYPDHFPFVLKSDGKQSMKYYIKQNEFDINETLAIASAIKNDRYMSIAMSNELYRKFLKSQTSIHNYQELLSLVEDEPIKTLKLTKVITYKITKLNQAIKDHCLVTYHTKGNEEHPNKDYIYKIVYVDSTPYVVIYHDKKLISMKVKDMIVDDWGSPFKDFFPRAKFYIEDIYDGNTNNPDDELKKSILPKGVYSAELHTFEVQKNDLQRVSESFYSFFYLPLPIKEKEDKVYCEFRCRNDLFIEWCTNYQVSAFIKVTGGEYTLNALEFYYYFRYHFINRLDTVRKKRTEYYIKENQKTEKNKTLVEITKELIYLINKKCLLGNENNIIMSSDRLESALSNQYQPYDTNEKIIASVYKAIVLDHAFENGNKRTAVIVMAYMAASIDKETQLSDEELYDLTMKIADAGGSQIEVDKIAKLLFDNTNSYMLMKPIEEFADSYVKNHEWLIKKLGE